jgi:NAD(P)-dependent dehydrogenase (short-subunit alcohol dehydrogenase family)
MPDTTRPVIVVTGGSRGIGAATARLAAGRGYDVVIAWISREDAAHEVVRDVEAAGARALAVRADVGVETGVLHLFAEVDRRIGRLDALVNNAGILEQQMRLDQMSAARWNAVFATNVTGAFLCAREAVRRMSTRHGGAGGAIVNVSSVAARTGSPGEYVDYAASKGALDAMTVGLAREVATEGVRVNGVRPAFVYTEIHARGGEPDRVERVKTRVPMQRGSQPDEVARAILWLLSDEASFTTGALLDVTGGL